MDLGRLAVTLPAPGVSSLESVELARRAECEWGYEAIWLAETNGPDSASIAAAVAMAAEDFGRARTRIDHVTEVVRGFV